MLSILAGRGALRVAVVGASCIAFTAVAQSIDVRVVQPERRDLVRVSAQPATAEAMHEADLGSKVSGQVTELNVDIGSRVRAGEVLARIAVPELIQARKDAPPSPRRGFAKKRTAKASGTTRSPRRKAAGA